jgi:predicted Zn-dependent protease
MHAAKLAPPRPTPRAKVKPLAIAIPKAQTQIARRSLAELRGYAPADLIGVAQIGYHYLFNGGTALAQVLFEGLVGVAPDEGYFVLALGLTYDRLDRPADAAACYRRAAELCPADPRPDINRAELAIAAGDWAEARALLTGARRKAAAANDAPLERKAACMLHHLDRLR